MNTKQLAARCRALAEVGRKHMRALAIQGVSGLSFDRLEELAEIMTMPVKSKAGPSPALSAAIAGIVAWIEQVQSAISREFPHNSRVEKEFLIGKPIPKDPEALVAAAREVRAAAALYPVNLLNRGLDASRIRHLDLLERNLRLALEADASQPDPKAAEAEARNLVVQIEQAASEAFKNDPATLEAFGSSSATSAPAPADDGGEIKKKGARKKTATA